MAEVRQFVGLILGSERYGINIMDVEEIIRMMDITTVPKAPAFVEGIINLRGRVIPVVDLRKRLGVPVSDLSANTRIIVVNIRDRRMGFIVDCVEEVLRIDSKTIDRAPGVSTAADRNYIEGVAKTEKGMVIILSVQKIFSPSEQTNMYSF